MLGRFTQADTIVPNMWYPISFDRYAYVNNNPVLNTDPTGHRCENAEECRNDPKPRVSDPIGDCISIANESARSQCLTSQGADTPLTSGGIKAYELYLYYFKYWKDNGLGYLSIEDFLGIIIYLEMGSLNDNDAAQVLMSEAAARQIWSDSSAWDKAHGVVGRIPYFCSGSKCYNGALNWIGTRTQVFTGQYNAMKSGILVPGKDVNMETAKAIGNSVLHPTNKNWKVFDPKRPRDWGNEGDGIEEWWNPNMKDKFNSLKTGQNLGSDEIVFLAWGYWDDNASTMNAFAIFSPDQSLKFNP